MQATGVKVADVAVAGETLKRERQRVGLSQLELARRVGAARATIGAIEARANNDDSQYLGKILDVLGLDQDGRPKGSLDVMNADLRGMQAHDLITLQGRLTAEMAWRMSQLPAHIQDPRVLPGSTVNPETPPPFGTTEADGSQEGEQQEA